MNMFAKNLLKVVERNWPEGQALAIIDEHLVLFDLETREVIEIYPDITTSGADYSETLEDDTEIVPEQ